MNSPIAMIVPGGVGVEHNIPSLVQLIHRLSLSRIIYLYSFSPLQLHPALDTENVVHIIPNAWCQKNHYISMIYIVFKIVFDYRAHSFSLIHCHWISPAGLTGIFANYFLKLPLVLTLPGGDTVYIPSIDYGGMRSPLSRFLIRWCCHHADSVVILSQFQQLIMKTNGIQPINLRMIPYGVDMTQFGFRPKQITYPLQLISIGNINRVKNIFLQLKTLDLLLKHIDCRLTIVGPDLMDGEIQTAAESLKIADRIEWKGQTDHSEIPELLHSSHIALHTAHYDAEAVVLMEAFAAGTVAVGMRVGLLADCDDDKNCTIDNSDHDLLAEKILRIIRDPRLYESLQARNRTFAEQHTIDWTVSQYEMVYGELLKGKSK
jgi:glycosyltransferase involved in cell wall biosynthesis